MINKQELSVGAIAIQDWSLMMKCGTRYDNESL